jgi:capsular exopolysaccharide synthesis family protein
MTRVDEALRQAAADGTVAIAAGIAPAMVPAGVRTLEHYPREDGGPEGPALQVDSARPDAYDLPLTIAESRGPVGEIAAAWADKLVTNPDVSELTVEQYRRLAAAIHDLQVQHGLKTLMVTSALPREGKTLTAMNLALTLSESYGKRVLLVDADLRHPALGQLCGVSDGAGLSEFLHSRGHELPLVNLSDRLRLLPAGRRGVNPMAALTSERMRLLLDRAAASFDWILVDTPPVGVLPDGQLLARLIRAVVFVIAAGSTPWPIVEKAVDELGRDSIVGTVLNGAEADAIGATSYYRHYSHAEDSAQDGKRAPSGG